MSKIDSFVGNIRRDQFGRTVVDTCASDGNHLRKDGPLPEGDDRHRCRRLVEEMFTEFEGKRGTLLVRVELIEDGDPEAELIAEAVEGWNRT